MYVTIPSILPYTLLFCVLSPCSPASLPRVASVGYQKRHPSEARERDHIRMLVFHLGDVERIDPSALQIFKEVLGEYQKRDVAVWICHVHPGRFDLLKLAGILDVIGLGRCS